MSDAPLTSAEADQWVELCAAVRAGLARQVALMGAMTPAEVGALAEAVDTALWCELKALTFDLALEQRREELRRLAAFGG